ncbi:MAG: JAB domain-containing protein [Bacteroidetes bacterium QS_9_68_14]|nr:MAG: JAB domain-containing protein [Bacteroidetes bacterium QS_9_68_14]
MPDPQDAPGEDAGEPAIAYHTPITEWDAGDRPREKLAKHGPAVLSDAELLALTIGSGTRTAEGPVSAVGLGKALGRTFGSLSELARREKGALTRVQGIGPAKAAKLLAAFEIGRRVEAEHADGDEERVQVQSPEDVAAAYGPQMRGLKKEVFKIVLLNTANVIEGDYTVSEGGLAASIVEPRAVFQRAILENAAAVICLHNHPSGNPEPSREDNKITRQLAEAGELVGIPVHDHLIIAGGGYTSLAERGVL